jgi:S-adenosylmethionine:tRNA ribosyltransferase-isomerase
MRIDDFDYELPAGAIAQTPAEPRDASRLLVAGVPPVDTTFDRLADHLRPGDLLVVNATRVRAARLVGTRPSGGAVEVLLLTRDEDEWVALARPARKLSAGMALDLGGLSALVLEVGGEGRVRLRLETGGEPVEDAIARAGSVPYPPYITRGPADPDRYQTVYAGAVGSAAAPTAGLHFTRELLDNLAARGVATTEVRLEIGLDTFRPITADTLEGHVMHREHYEVTGQAVEAVNRARAAGGRVVAVGTTATRALEAASAGGELAAGAGWTDLFIQPGYRARTVDALLTNFHLPRSSLIVMIAAFHPGWRQTYRHALQHGYRFLSFGDAMLIPEVR